MSSETWTVNIDGGSRGNPGLAAYGVVIQPPGGDIIEQAECIGTTTNNVAEYTALVRALERCLALGAKELRILSDSELLVKQMKGQYKVKNEGLKDLYQKARNLWSEFERVSISHVYRENNSRADALCNAAMDGSPKPPPSAATAPVVQARPAADVRSQVVARLQAAARSWAAGDPSIPEPEKVWSEIWDIVATSLK